MDAALGPLSSFTWRSIWSAKALVKEGLLWRVGDGSKINIWNDPWLIDEQSRFATTMKPNDESYDLVAELINREGKDWNLELIGTLINNLFNDRDRDLILGIPISERLPKDCVSWACSKDGDYDVGSAYLLGTSINIDDFEHYWVEVWKADVSPKVRHFLWRCCTASLPTRSNLKQRHLIEDDICPFCGLESETIFHALLSCPSVKNCWSKVGLCGVSLLEGITSFGQLLIKCKELFDDSKRQFCYFLMWSLWHRRNRWIFYNIKPLDDVFMRGVQRIVSDFGSYSNRIYGGIGSNHSCSSDVWKAPPAEVIKINASVPDNGWIGMGAVACNSRGEVLFAVVRRVKARWKPFIAECKAALLGVKKANSYGFSNIVLESDSLGLISKLKNNIFSLPEADNILEDLVSLSKAFCYLSWSHVKRDGNQVAHHLARLVPISTEQVWENNFPNEVYSYVIMDSLSI